MNPLGVAWHNLQTLSHRYYDCGYCGKATGINVGYGSNNKAVSIYICGGCNRPTYFEVERMQVPSPILGNEVAHLPKEVEYLYQEARKCTQVEAYTSCVLTCRVILMYIAVKEGAKKRLSFEQYVDYLADHNYLPPGGKGWVDRIRKVGNIANHRIEIMDKERAFEILSFVEMLLKFVYEYPIRSGANKKPSNDDNAGT